MSINDATPEEWNKVTHWLRLRDAIPAIEIPNNIASTAKETSTPSASDGSTASYYELPRNAHELQDLISFKCMNAQIGEIFRASYRYGEVAHSKKLRDAKKIKYYAEAEIKRLESGGH